MWDTCKRLFAVNNTVTIIITNYNTTVIIWSHNPSIHWCGLSQVETETESETETETETEIRGSQNHHPAEVIRIIFIRMESQSNRKEWHQPPCNCMIYFFMVVQYLHKILGIRDRASQTELRTIITKFTANTYGLEGVERITNA